MEAATKPRPSRRPKARNVNTNGSVDRGLLQLNSIHKFKGDLTDPETNMKRAVSLYHRAGESLDPWKLNGSVKNNLPQVNETLKDSPDEEESPVATTGQPSIQAEGGLSDLVRRAAARRSMGRGGSATTSRLSSAGVKGRSQLRRLIESMDTEPTWKG